MAIDTTTSVDVQTLTPFKKFIMTIGTLPTSYLESMTYAELLMWFCNYLQNTVIPTVNNNAEAVEELQGLYEELRSYVNDYFDNLDVQEEINNKLDKMASDGTLNQLIIPYIDDRVNALETYLNNEVDDINTKIDALDNGSPLVASSTSGMTDTTKTYVNTTDGYWYYYNGSAWVQGGVYQASGLSENDVNFENLSTALQSEIGFKSDTYTGNEFILGEGLSGSTGQPYTADARFTTGLLDLNYIKISGLTTYQYNIYKFNKTNGTYIGAEGWKAIDNSYYTCNDNYLYKISIRISSDDTGTATEEDMEAVTIYNYIIKNNVSIFNLDQDLQQQIKMLPVSMNWEIGTISGTGNNSDSIYRLRTIDYYQFDSDVIIKNNPSYNIMIFEYNSNKSFNQRTIYNRYSNIIFTPDSTKYYRFIYAYDRTQSYEMHLTDLTNLSVVGYKKDLTTTLPDQYLYSCDSIDFGFASHGFNTGSYASGITMVKDYLVEFGISSDDHADFSNCNLYYVDLTNRTIHYVKTIQHNFGHVNSVDYCTANDTLIFGNGSGSFEQKGKFYAYEGFYDLISNALTETMNINNAIEYDCTSYPIGDEYKFNCCWADGNGGKNDTIILVTNNYRNIRKIQLGKGANELELGTYTSGTDGFNGTFKIVKEYTQTTGSATGTDNTYAVQDLSYYDNKLYGGVGHGLNCYWIMKLNQDGSITREEQFIDLTDNSGDPITTSVANIYVTKGFMICNIGNYMVYNK